MDRAARLIKGVARRDRITPVLIELYWLPIKARIIFKICVMVYWTIRYGKPDYLRQILEDHQPGSAVSLGSSDDPFMLIEQRCNPQMGYRAFRTSTPRLCNLLPRDIKGSNNIDTFKKLKMYLFSDCYTQDIQISEFYKV
ncbi:uncharacterized protein LOC143020543 [Oratosquilla oratoria]|uniref:uncharacterized protein LOC143020543 n=1 Tax=Oratosquilla oratoria TaxID=337810 RepID=UPI003F757FC5